MYDVKIIILLKIKMKCESNFFLFFSPNVWMIRIVNMTGNVVMDHVNVMMSNTKAKAVSRSEVIYVFDCNLRNLCLFLKESLVH